MDRGLAQRDAGASVIRFRLAAKIDDHPHVEPGYARAVPIGQAASNSVAVKI